MIPPPKWSVNTDKYVQLQFFGISMQLLLLIPIQNNLKILIYDFLEYTNSFKITYKAKLYNRFVRFRVLSNIFCHRFLIIHTQDCRFLLFNVGKGRMTGRLEFPKGSPCANIAAGDNADKVLLHFPLTSKVIATCYVQQADQMSISIFDFSINREVLSFKNETLLQIHAIPYLSSANLVLIQQASANRANVIFLSAFDSFKDLSENHGFIKTPSMIECVYSHYQLKTMLLLFTATSGYGITFLCKRKLRFKTFDFEIKKTSRAQQIMNFANFGLLVADFQLNSNRTIFQEVHIFTKQT